MQNLEGLGAGADGGALGQPVPAEINTEGEGKDKL
jgi:hypothetical protein